MWATVRRYEGVTNPDEAGKRVREGFVPLMSDHRGFVAYYWVDAGDGVMFSTSVFEDSRPAFSRIKPTRRIRTPWPRSGSRRISRICCRTRRRSRRAMWWLRAKDGPDARPGEHAPGPSFGGRASTASEADSVTMAAPKLDCLPHVRLLTDRPSALVDVPDVVAAFGLHFGTGDPRREDVAARTLHGQVKQG